MIEQIKEPLLNCKDKHFTFNTEDIYESSLTENSFLYSILTEYADYTNYTSNYYITKSNNNNYLVLYPDVKIYGKYKIKCKLWIKKMVNKINKFIYN
jgi:hypothetical protein